MRRHHQVLIVIMVGAGIGAALGSWIRPGDQPRNTRAEASVPPLPAGMRGMDYIDVPVKSPPAPSPSRAADAIPATHVPGVTDSTMPADMAFTRPMKRDVNPAVAAVSEAHKTGRNLERLSSMAAIPDFSMSEYMQDTAAYCSQVIPGRAYQSAPPGPDIPVIQYAGSSDLTAPLGGTCRLGAIAKPGAPVSALAVGLGAFANGLTAITVQADEQGEAWIDYHATAGTIGAVTVLVASPVTSCQLSFQITVIGPDEGKTASTR